MGWTEGWRQQEEGVGRDREEVWVGANAAAVCGGQQQWYTRWCQLVPAGTSWSWDEMWTWKQPISKDYSVSYERFDGKSLSLQHRLAISFGCCCDGAGMSPGSVPHRLNCLVCPVSHTHIAAAANLAG